ncbi:hypothetical protein [Nocardia sp. NPDC058497]|uniref:hypothetical protein n=1 Tax=Nocardia sp. NPDC058497 TaxID=3346529 RepID=UPI0036639DB1
MTTENPAEAAIHRYFAALQSGTPAITTANAAGPRFRRPWPGQQNARRPHLQTI